MGSLTKQYSHKKLTGKIYTPDFIVEKILDEIGYNKTENIVGKRILDPSCGDGRFILKIAERIIEFVPSELLKESLENIYGWDIDKQAIDLTIEKLNRLVQPYQLKINWQITVQDALKVPYETAFKDIKFDYIVGNPPYIRIQHLEPENRVFIQKNYNFCKSGSTDIYIAFYELAIRLLKSNGSVGLITPNTFFTTETALPLRQFFVKHQNILKITNYGSIQVFDKASTYSAIVMFDKKKRKYFSYQKAESLNNFKQTLIKFEALKDKQFWALSIKKQPNFKGKKLGEIAKIHVGITTLADKIYIMPQVSTDGKFMYLQSKYSGIVSLEKDILKPIIKVSKLKNGNQPPTEYIIFPYQKNKGKYQIIPEKDLKEKYPLTYQYLLAHKTYLDKRDNGKPNKVAWYAFGRSQGLNTSFGPKILFSPMNKKPNFIFSPFKDTSFYSGYCIKYNGDQQALLQQLNSRKMADYIEISARDLRNGWKAYNKKIVQEFRIEDLE